jgi:MFS superfamily sulfate permease-like transporter
MVPPDSGRAQYLILPNVKKSTNYFKSLIYDFPSSIVVFLVALPLCLGIALGSNAPLFSGLSPVLLAVLL